MSDALTAVPGPAPDAHPHPASDEIDASDAFILSLEGMSDEDVLTSLLGEGHCAVFGRSPRPIAAGPQPARDSANVDDHGAVPDDAKTPSAVDDLQQATASAELKLDEAQTPARRKRAHESNDENGPPLDKRRRVRTELQPGLPTASPLRLRVPLDTLDTANSSAAATRTTIQLSTTAAVAPSPENKDQAVVEPKNCVTSGHNEVSITSPRVEPAQEAVPSAGPSRLARQPRGRTEPSADVRRSKRVAILEAVTRKRAAATVRAVAKAGPVPRRRGKSVGGRGKARGTTRSPSP